MKTPNFIIVGAPKCGTTALSTYLGEHPQIFMCWPKEPHYFAVDLPSYRHVSDWESYLALFSCANDVCKAIGEASVFYLYSDLAIAEIRKTLPDARLIVMLRNPVELAVSMHAQALLTRDETMKSFSKAWAMCNSRRNGRRLPRHCRESKVLLYDELPKLGKQLQRLLDSFPRSQVRCLFYDDFSIDPGRVYREALEFLGLPDDGRDLFPRINPRRRTHFQWLAQLTEKTPGILTRSAMRLKDTVGIERWGVLDALRRYNFSIAQKTVLPSGLIMEMQAKFAPDIELLEHLTGRDLTGWLQNRNS